MDTSLYGLAGMVVLFVIGPIIGAVLHDGDTAGAITVTLWAISVIGAAVRLLLPGTRALRRRSA